MPSDPVADNAKKEKSMKNIVTKSGLFVAAGLAILAMAAPAYAQNRLMRVDIPFSFLAGEQRLPAGRYWVSFDGAFHTLDLRQLDARSTYRVRVQDGRATRKWAEADRGVLSFRKYGANLVLKGVFVSGGMERHDLQTSKAEIELAKAGALPAGGEASVDLLSR
jgi:hypothetical protein